MHCPADANVMSFKASNWATTIILHPDNTYSCKALITEETWIYFEEHHELYGFILKVLFCLSSQLRATSVCDFNLDDYNRTSFTSGNTGFYSVRFSFSVTKGTLTASPTLSGRLLDDRIPFFIIQFHAK